MHEKTSLTMLRQSANKCRPAAREIFRWVDYDGPRPPLLALFNEETLAKGVETLEQVRREQELLDTQQRFQIAEQR